MTYYSQPVNNGSSKASAPIRNCWWYCRVKSNTFQRNSQMPAQRSYEKMLSNRCLSWAVIMLTPEGKRARVVQQCAAKAVSLGAPAPARLAALAGHIWSSLLEKPSVFQLLWSPTRLCSVRLQESQAARWQFQRITSTPDLREIPWFRE